VSGTQAQKDKAEWLNALALTLPEGTGKVEKTGALVTISVQWNDNRGRIKTANDAETGIEKFVYRTEI
jgi:type IV pilus assembly protein PilV